MNKKHILIAAAIGLLLGAAYASKVKSLPVVGTVASKLPGADA
ncbi:MAG TPA: hypothetical protein VL357_12805 [Rariglobus sp.]|jgi:hypothetical protein|nr:hypothetical protein [Rariglobus sp.]